MPNHYNTLGVPKDADSAAIKKAYRRKAAQAHPDRVGGGNSHQAMVAVNRAYETLSDPQKRAHYDQTGEDGSKRQPSIDQMAMQALFQLFMQLMEQAPEEIDHVAAATQSVVANIDKIRENLAKLQSLEGTIRKRLKRLKFKGKGRNILHDCLEQRAKQVPDQVAAGEQQIKALERAIELLKDYDWKQAEWPSFFGGGSVFVFTVG